jgi:hypothetical protein
MCLFVCTIAVECDGQTINPNTQLRGMSNIQIAANYSGADMGAKINAAATKCGANCTIIAGPAATISTALNLPAETVLILQPGFWTIATGHTIANNGIKILGYGPAATVLDMSTATGDLFTVNGNDFQLKGVQIRAAAGVPRTAGSVINGVGNAGQVEDVKIVDPFRGFSLVTTTADNWVFNDIQIATSGGNWDYLFRLYAASGTLATTHINNVKGTVSGSTQTSPMFIFDSRVDTVIASNIEVNQQSQSCIKTQDTDGVGGFPRWIHFVNSMCEAPGTTGIDLGVARDFTFTNGYVASSLNAVHIGAGAVDVRFTANVFVSIAQHGIVIDTNTSSMSVFNGNIFEDIGTDLTNTYDIFSIGANATSFVISNNIARKVGATLSRYGINIASGTSTNFTISHNFLSAAVTTGVINNLATGATFNVIGNLGTTNQIIGDSITLSSTTGNDFVYLNGVASGQAIRWQMGNRDIKFDSTGGTGVVKFTNNTGATTTASVTPNTGALVATTYGTITNCASSSGACSAAVAGRVSIAAAATTVVVATTAVTANSEIKVQEDASVGAALSVTCNTTTGRIYTITARTAGTSFTITASAAPATNPACLTFSIVN